SLPFGRLTRHEIMRGAANRLLYSRFYTYYYAIMFMLGLVSLVTAFVETCPSVFFIVVEGVLCLCMMMEIVTRVVAMQWSFLGSWWNYFDVVIVLFCGITLILLSRGCSASSNSEELINTILVVVRNAAQIFRLLATLRKNRRQMDAQGLDVDLENNGSSFLDIINDVDGLMEEPEHQYHLHHDYQQGGGGGGSGSGADFRLSIDSFGGVDSGPEDGMARPASAGARQSISRSSATSLNSVPDRLAGRRRASP
ncbi:hypothetical protein LPJ61_006143, partial [Coemansia biformis]